MIVSSAISAGTPLTRTDLIGCSGEDGFLTDVLVPSIHQPFKREELGEVSLHFDTVCEILRVTNNRKFCKISFDTFGWRVCGFFHCIDLQVFHSISVVSTDRLIFLPKLIDC